MDGRTALVTPIRAAVIGLGVGERHVASYQSIDEVEVVAVCDLDVTRLHEVADRYKVRRRVIDYRQITEDDTVDVVSVCSYDDAHVDQATSALANGKHVMIEKPVALTPDDGHRLFEAWTTSGCILTSNLILRASPRFIELRKDIADGVYGDVFYIEGDYIHQILWKLTDGWRGRLQTYSVVYGGGIHLIDLTRWLLGSEIREVCGMGTDLLTAGSAYRSHDTTVNIMRFESGALGKTFTTLGPRRPKIHRLDVYGTKATFVNETGAARRFLSDTPGEEEVISTPYPGMEKGDLLPELVEAIREGGEPPVSASDVFRVMAVCFAAEESIVSGRTVEVTYLD